jgi:hypothetical protein
MYVHMWMEQNVDLHKMCLQKSEKRGTSLKAQPQSEGCTFLTLLKALCANRNSSNITSDRGAHIDHNSVIRSTLHLKLMEWCRLGQILSLGATGFAQVNVALSFRHNETIGRGKCNRCVCPYRL